MNMLEQSWGVFVRLLRSEPVKDSFFTALRQTNVGVMILRSDEIEHENRTLREDAAKWREFTEDVRCGRVVLINPRTGNTMNLDRY